MSTLSPVLCTLTDQLVVDIETGSSVDLFRVTPDVYATHPSTLVYCVVFRAIREGVDEMPVFRWTPPADPDAIEMIPPFIAGFINQGGSLVAWNVGFERSIWERILTPRYGWPEVPTSQWVDAQAYSAVMALPAALDKAAHAIAGVDIHKDSEGAKLMKQLCVTVPDGRGGWRAPDLMTDENLHRLTDYCEQDVLVTAAVLRLLWKPSIHETMIWRACQDINARGLCLDLVRAGKMARLATQREQELEAHVEDLTVTALGSVTGVPKLKAWLTRRGVVDAGASLSAEVIREMLTSDDMPADVREVLQVRLEVGRLASLAKLRRLSDVVSPDGRARGLLRYYGAHTGRWSSRILQVHNLTKDRRSAPLQALCATAIDAEDLSLLECFDAPLDALSAAIRSLVVAAPGYDLIASDLTAIEARVLAWLAGDASKVAFLYTFDGQRAAGEKPQDLYQRTAASIGSDNRQLGKVCELALGYGMGALLFIDAAKRGGILLPPKEARKIQRAWRAANPKIVAFWSALETAVRAAIQTRGSSHMVGMLKVHSTEGGSVIIDLPSGRQLWYHRCREEKRDRKVPVLRDDGSIEYVAFDIPAIVYEIADAGGMMTADTYGGKLAENVTQAVARDVLGEALLTLRDDPIYRVVLHVHDSVVAEVPEGAGSVAEFSSRICTMPAWAAGLPLAADGYRDKRFHG